MSPVGPAPTTRTSVSTDIPSLGRIDATSTGPARVMHRRDKRVDGIDECGRLFHLRERAGTDDHDELLPAHRPARAHGEGYRHSNEVVPPTPHDQRGHPARH